MSKAGPDSEKRYHLTRGVELNCGSCTTQSQSSLARAKSRPLFIDTYEFMDVPPFLQGPRVAIRLFEDVPELRKRYWGRKPWSREYFVRTIGVNEWMIRQYVQKQEVKERQAKQLGFDY